MSRARRAVLALAVTSVVACAVAAPTASAADVVLPFSNYKVGGTLTVKKLNQSITLPAGSTFNGSANVTQGTLSGHVSIPTFTSTIRVLGIPTQVTTQLVEAQPVQGTVKLDPDLTTHIRSSTSATLYIRKLRLGLLSVPTTCRTVSPIQLTLNYDGPFSFPINFNGTTTIPPLVGCGLLGPTLGALLSGPGNAYHLTLSPPS
ncbi:MAG TPA: hypothetical protein VHR40_02755 [Thermoleophilaceae bacterium]|jgi:hypothetical protein|nr:hypothetical protein [Thermoleophilaceae bacterium]